MLLKNQWVNKEIKEEINQLIPLPEHELYALFVQITSPLEI